MIVSSLPIICLVCAVLLLVVLCIIDLRVRLLPNIFTLPFALLAPAFHFLTDFQIIGYMDMLIGGAVGYGFLFILRAVANVYYKQDSLGLGDVKLMGGAGLWLGVEGVLVALTVGAFAGLLHGIVYAFVLALKDRKKPNFHRLAIPAGPGFAVGIVVSGLWILHESGYIVLPL